MPSQMDGCIDRQLSAQHLLQIPVTIHQFQCQMYRVKYKVVTLQQWLSWRYCYFILYFILS